MAAAIPVAITRMRGSIGMSEVELGADVMGAL
jgi:hypothetical protein